MMEELMKKDTQTGEKSFSEDMIDFISKVRIYNIIADLKQSKKQVRILWDI